MELRWPGAYGVVKKRRRSDGGATPYSKRLAVALSSIGIVGAALGGYGISRRPLSPWPEALSTGVSRGRFDQDDHEVGAMAIAPLTDLTHVWDPLPAHAALPPGLCRGRFDLVADALARFTDITHFFYVAWGWDPRLTHAAPRGANYTLLCNIPNCPKRFQVLVLDPFEPFGRIQLTLLQRGSKTRPGSHVAWAGFRDLSDAELVGEHALWAALREGLNCSNRIIYRYSGSLFMYADHRSGAYAKNTSGNIYAAVGVFVLDHLFREAWGSKPPKIQLEFNGFLEVLCTRDSHLGPSLREICAANRSDEKQQMKALLENVGSSICPDHCDRLLATHFLQARPTDYATKKLQACIKLGDSMGLCTLLVSGYLQTPSLVVNQLVHVSGAGDFQLGQNDILKDLCPVNESKNSDIVHVFVPDPLNQEPSLVENIPDPLAGEQAPETFFTASDQNSLDKTVSRYRMVRSLHNMSTSGRQIQILALLVFIFSFFTPFVHAESGIHTCPRYSIADVLPRTTCPVVKLTGAHWLHSKRIHHDLKDRHIVYPCPFTFYLESNCTKCTLLQDFLLVIGILLLWPVLMNLNERKQVNIFSFDRHLISVWIEITVSCILYCACWIIYGNLISSSEDDEISHFGSHIYSINCIACFSYLLWLVVLLFWYGKDWRFIFYRLLGLFCLMIPLYILRDDVFGIGLLGFCAMAAMYTLKWLTIVMDELARKRRQLIVRGAGLVAGVYAYMMLMFRRSRQQTPRITVGSMDDRAISRESNLRYIYHSSDINCSNQLRMRKAPFFRLCAIFRERKLLFVRLAVLDYLTEHKAKGLNFVKMNDEVRQASFKRILKANPDLL